jgi:hypothetical protein
MSEKSTVTTRRDADDEEVARTDPHPSQNRAPSRFVAPHAGHVAIASKPSPTASFDAVGSTGYHAPGSGELSGLAKPS